MPDNTLDTDLAADNAALQAENAQLKTQIAALEETIQQFHAERRQEAVKALFAELGRDSAILAIGCLYRCLFRAARFMICSRLERASAR